MAGHFGVFFCSIFRRHQVEIIFIVESYIKTESKGAVTAEQETPYLQSIFFLVKFVL